MHNSYDFEWDGDKMIVAKLNGKDLSEEDKVLAQQFFEREKVIRDEQNDFVKKAEDIYNEKFSILKKEWKKLYDKYPPTKKLSSKKPFLALSPFSFPYSHSFLSFWF